MRRKRKTAIIEGYVPRIVNGESIATVARAVNYNAEVLENLIKRVEKLEQKVSERNE